MRANRIVWGVLLVTCLALVVSCGGAREVTSCSQCNNNSNPHFVEYCVLGQTSQLY
jgi:hypothetical protein